MKASILLVEDDPAVARAVEYALTQEGWQVRRAADARGGLAAALDPNPPDLILLDVRLPDGNGFDLCRQIRQTSRVPIVFLTARDEELDRVLGLELGADDYITKPFSPRELVSRVRAHLRRAYGELAGQREEHLRLGDLLIFPARRRVVRGDETIPLTNTEFEILRLLLEQPGRVWTREQILSAIWETDTPVGDDRVVNVHIRNLRRKIEPDPERPRYVLTVRGVGYQCAPNLIK